MFDRLSFSSTQIFSQCTQVFNLSYNFNCNAVDVQEAGRQVGSSHTSSYSFSFLIDMSMHHTHMHTHSHANKHGVSRLNMAKSRREKIL